ncbi:MAG: hypothetical protein ACK4RK_05970 [Gemmataceae bacterium]
MERLATMSLGKLTALLTLGAVALILAVSGQQMFSPGPLNAQSRRNVALGGVMSHAALSGNCAACHVPPWSRETMASRCLNCHVNVREQIEGGLPLHGQLAEAMQCRHCHTEHQGARGVLTDMTKFDHACTRFPLTGQHQTVACAACHVNHVFQGTPRDCATCHAEPRVHRGRFGTRCDQCHTTDTWTGAVFAHSFPLNHGGGKNKQRACATCHTNADDYQTYTCYGCHRHDPGKTLEKHLKRGIGEIDDCAGCHPNGRKHKRGAAVGKHAEREEMRACRREGTCGTLFDALLSACCPADHAPAPILADLKRHYPLEKADHTDALRRILEPYVSLAPHRERLTLAPTAPYALFQPTRTSIANKMPIHDREGLRLAWSPGVSVSFFLDFSWRTRVDLVD